jgi:tetratricopeptide (TPR) repeat protein
MRSRLVFNGRLSTAALILVLSACATSRIHEARPAATIPQDGPPPASTGAVTPPPPAAQIPAVPQSQAEMADQSQAAPPAIPSQSAPATQPVQPPARETPQPKAPSSPYVFEVTVASKDPSHPFYGVGSRLGFVVDGVPGKTLVVVRGKTYHFKVDTNIQHDFYLSTNPAGWGAAAYTEGVEGQFIYQGVVDFTPTARTPDLLYYACRNHKNMGGPILVVNEGEEGKAIDELRASRGVPAVTQGQGQALEGHAAAASEMQVKQKIQFADMFIHQSAAAKRIKESGQAAVLDLYRSALDKFESAKQSLAAQKYSDALAQVDDSVRLMSEASRQVPEKVSDEVQRAKFDELYKGVESFEASYTRNYDQMVKKKGAKNVPKVDLNQIHAIMESARGLARDGKYDEAVSMLGNAQDTLTSALSQMLASESISYELKFDTPKDEYEYELSRYQSYEELIPLAIEQKQPSEQALKLMNSLVDRAKEIRALAEPEAKKGNYTEAIQMLQGATSHIERALRVVGVQ